MGIAYCDGRRLKRLFLAGSDRILAHRAELDRINVYPVPDGDTGTNLALTLRSMADAVSGLDDPSVSRVAARLAEAGVLAARGNSGMMLSHLFLGFADGLGDRRRAGPRELASAIRRAADSLYQAVDRPVEGTILTVVRESAEAAERIARQTADLVALTRHMLEVARASLARTPSLLPALREANVVDAGAKGFVLFLKGVVSLIDGKLAGAETMPEASAAALRIPVPAAAASFLTRGEQSFRYCSEFVVRGTALPDQRALAGAVRGLGDSLIVTRTTNLAKIHIHTDEPARVLEALAFPGGTAECVKKEDMREQHRALRRPHRRVAVVTDATCDLPGELLIEHDITVVPLSVMFGDEVFLDQLEITHERLLERLADPNQPPPTTSQPSPADLERSFARAAEQAEEVLGIFVAGVLSGTLGQAQAMAARFSGVPVQVYDSRSGSLGLGFQVLRAAELAREGRTAAEIVAELDRVRERSGLLLTVDRLDYLRRSGRVAKARAFLATLLDLKPVLSVDRDGALVPVDRVRGREALPPRVLELLRRRVPKVRGRLRLGVAHVGCAGTAEALARTLRREFEPDQLFVRPAAGVIAAHTGPGAWGVFYQAG